MKRDALVVVCGLLLTAPLMPGGGEPGDDGEMGPPDIYVVQVGDTLVEIAEHLEVTEAALRQANGIDPEENIVTPGQVLVVPAASVTTSMSTTSSTTVSSSTTTTISSTEQSPSSTATRSGGERDRSPGQGFPHWPSLFVGLVVAIAGLAVAVRSIQWRWPPWPITHGHVASPSVGPSESRPTDLHPPPALDRPEAPPTSTSPSLTKGVEASEATDEVEAAVPAVVRQRDRPYPYELSVEPLRTRLLALPPELAPADAPFTARAHSLMSPRGLVRIDDHLLVLGEIIDGYEAKVAPGQALIVEP